MTNEENGGFDAGAFFEEGVAEAGIDPEEVVTDSPDPDDSANVISQVAEVADKAGSQETAAAETKTADKAGPSVEDVTAAIESTKETEQEVESVISALLPKQTEPEAAKTKTDFEPGKYVPVEDHIKLRARAQAAEREAEDLRQRLETSTTQTGGVKPGEEAEKSPLEKFVDDNPDEEFTLADMPLKVQLAESKFQEAKAQKAQQAKEKAELIEREKQEKQYRTKAAIKAITQKAEQSEAEFRKANPDYEAVVKPFVAANMLTNEERLAFFKDDNPAKRLYEICKAKADALRGVLGVTATTTTTPAKNTTTSKAPAENPADTDEDDMTDDEIFAAIAAENFKAGQ